MNESGFCKCGCGGITRKAARTEKKHGWVAGEHRDFLRGHGKSMTTSQKLQRPTEAGDDDCWFKSKRRGGRYSNTKINGEHTGLHRASYEFYIGKIPEGLQVCHTCDNGHCYNPKHLFAGTGQDNMTDKVKKGRCPRGERHGRAVLTEEQAISVIKDTRPRKEIASSLGVGLHVVSYLKRGMTWKHLKREQC